MKKTTRLLAIGGVALALGAVIGSGAHKLLDGGETTKTGSDKSISGKPSAAEGTEVQPASNTAPNDALKPFYAQRIAWKDCEGGLQCATVAVPLDYSKPSGERLEVTINRLPAETKATGNKAKGRIGSLLLNPGGPGGSGLDFAKQAKVYFGEEIRKRFDIVGFDPRGVGESTPIVCLDAKDKDRFLTEDSTYSAQKDIAGQQRLQAEFVQGCVEKSGKLLPHVGTENVARDLDILRAVVGDQKLSYLGLSYGSQLGATYADLFPKRVRALALDGAVDPAADPLEGAIARATGAESALRAFTQDCLKAPDCPLSSRTAKTAMDEIVALWQRADRKPMTNTAQRERKVTGAWVAAGVRFALYSKQGWPYLRTALSQAIRSNDGTMFQQFTDPFVGRRPDGTWTNSIDASSAISCADWPRIDRKTAEQAASRAKKAAPHFGTDISLSWLSCDGWPVDPPKTSRVRDAAGSAPILVIGTLRDPSTPYTWATALAGQLDNSRLLTYEGDGHTAYRVAGSSCVDKAVDSYLLNATLPKPGMRCKA